MSSSDSTYHIPFPRTFLSLNSTSRQAASPASSTVVSPTPEPTTHTFLSNRPAGRSYSVSSTSSDVSASTVSPPASPSTMAVDAPILEARFLPLNSKVVAPPTTAKEIKPVEKSPFLSNRH